MLDQTIVSVGEEYKPKYNDLEIIDTVLGNEIPWIWVNDMYIAAQCVCTNINWLRLDQAGYVKGRQVNIDGKSYICRLPKVGMPKTRNDSEWDKAIFLTGADDNIWHWKDQYFWGLEEMPGNFLYKFARGMSDVKQYHAFNRSLWRNYIGFRPVLVPAPLKISAIQTGDMLQLTVKGRCDKVIGKVLDTTEYDLFLDPEFTYFETQGWATEEPDGTLVIDKQTIQKAIQCPIMEKSWIQPNTICF